MLHRHLNHQNYTLAAVDDIIARGKKKDWAELRRSAISDKNIMEKVYGLAARIAMIHTRSDIIFGCSMQNDTLPEWERVIHAAAHLQRILPEAVLVGGAASALYAEHRLSTSADHVLTDLRKRFDDILIQLESVSGWQTARITRPVQILGSLDGIETGVRQLIRTEPLETQRMDCHGVQVTVPTASEMIRIKGVLILKRNATRDYLDFAALADRLGDEGIIGALCVFDRLYPQKNEESALQQLQIQLSTPMPYDLDQMNLSEYKNIAPQWKK